MQACNCADTNLDRDLYWILVKEVGNPSFFFGEIVARFLKLNRDCLCSLLREYLGPDVPGECGQRLRIQHQFTGSVRSHRLDRHMQQLRTDLIERPWAE